MIGTMPSSLHTSPLNELYTDVHMIINGDAKGHLIYYNFTCLWKLRLRNPRLYCLTPNPVPFKYYMEKLTQPSLLYVCACAFTTVIYNLPARCVFKWLF